MSDTENRTMGMESDSNTQVEPETLEDFYTQLYAIEDKKKADEAAKASSAGLSSDAGLPAIESFGDQPAETDTSLVAEDSASGGATETPAVEAPIETPVSATTENTVPRKDGILRRLLRFGKAAPVGESPVENTAVTSSPLPTEATDASNPAEKTGEKPVIDGQAILNKLTELINSGAYDELFGDEKIKQAVIDANSAAVLSADSLSDLRVSLMADINTRLGETDRFTSRQDQMYQAGKLNELMNALLGQESGDGTIVLTDGTRIEPTDPRFKDLNRQKKGEFVQQGKEVVRRDARVAAQRVKEAAGTTGEVKMEDLVPPTDALVPTVEPDAVEGAETEAAESEAATVDNKDTVDTSTPDLAVGRMAEAADIEVTETTLPPETETIAQPERNVAAQRLIDQLEQSGIVSDLGDVEKSYLFDQVTTGVNSFQTIEAKQSSLEGLIKNSLVDHQLSQGADIANISLNEEQIDGLVSTWSEVVKAEYGNSLEFVLVQTDEITNALQNGNQEDLRVIAEATKFVRESRQVGENDDSGVKDWFTYKLFYLDGLCKQYVQNKLDSVKVDENMPYYQGFQELRRILKAAYGDQEISDAELAQLASATAESQLGKRPSRSELAQQRAQYRESEKARRSQERQVIYASNQEKAQADVQAALQGVITTFERVDSTVRSIKPAVGGAIDAVGTYVGQKIDAVDTLASQAINAAGRATSGVADVYVEVSTLYPAAEKQLWAGLLELRKEVARQVGEQIIAWWTKRSAERNAVIDAKIAELKGSMKEAEAELKLKMSDGGKLSAIQRFARHMGRL